MLEVLLTASLSKKPNKVKEAEPSIPNKYLSQIILSGIIPNEQKYNKIEENIAINFSVNELNFILTLSHKELEKCIRCN